MVTSKHVSITTTTPVPIWVADEETDLYLVANGSVGLGGPDASYAGSGFDIETGFPCSGDPSRPSYFHLHVGDVLYGVTGPGIVGPNGVYVLAVVGKSTVLTRKA